MECLQTLSYKTDCQDMKEQKKSNRQQKRMKEILKLLKKTYPEARCQLSYSDPFQLLVSTVLSAQCTDARVNQVTPVLFARFRTPQELAGADLSEIEKIIRPTGFYRNKARSLKEIACILVKNYEGCVPAEMDELIKLRGVGRKTANVVLGNAFGIPGLVVDTHVGRLCRRMGFADSKDPMGIEEEMMKIVPKRDWTLRRTLYVWPR